MGPLTARISGFTFKKQIMRSHNAIHPLCINHRQAVPLRLPSQQRPHTAITIRRQVSHRHVYPGQYGGIVRTGGSLTAVASGEEVVPASELAAANKQIRELQRLLGKKTMEAEILKEAVEFGRAKKWIAHAPSLPFPAVYDADAAQVLITLQPSYRSDWY